MSFNRRFVTGVAGLSLGNALLAGSYALDQMLLGPFTMVALASTAISSVGSGLLAYLAYTNPDTFDFKDSRLHQHFPTITFACGIITFLTGIMLIIPAVVE